MLVHPVFLFFFACFVFIWSAKSCLTPLVSNTSYNRSGPAYQNEISISSEAAADGLELKALNSIVKQSKDARDLEYHLNQPGSINNLDLNNDGKVDYISVTEYGNKADAYGFSLTVEPEKGQIQEVATIEIVQDGDRAKVQYNGNSQIYGPGHHYSAFHTLGTFLMWSYLLSPHPFYASPWGFGQYPGYYSSYRTVPNSAYQNRNRGSYSDVKSTSSSQVAKGKNISSPNKNKVANSGIKKSLKNPTSTQKAFQTRAKSKSISRGGFGRSSSSLNKSSSYSGRSIRGYSSSRSRGFGGFGK